MKKVLIPGLGIGIVDASYHDVLADLQQNLRKYHNLFVVFFEANLLSMVLKDQEVRTCIKQADWVLPDGVAVGTLAGLYNDKAIERISGPTFMLKACEYGQTLQWKHFFYGGTPESMPILLDKLKTQFPDLQIAGTYTPPFRPLNLEEDQAVCAQINSSGADFVWVGLGGPKQERWIIAHRDKISVPVMLGVGAAFDFHAGTRPWAPTIVRKLGLEWLFRTCSGGRRTFFRNVRCVRIVFFYLLAEWFRTLLKKRS